MTATEAPSSRRNLQALAAGTTWSLLAEIVRLIAGIAVFLLLTRAYEPVQYGRLVGALALLAFVLPQATIGSSYLILERVAGQGWEARAALRQAVGASLLGGSMATIALVVARPLLLPQVPLLALLLLGVSELVAGGIIEATAFLAQATGRLGALAVVRVTSGVSRLAAAGLLVAVSDDPPLSAWAALAAGTAALTALVGHIVTVGRPCPPAMVTRQDLRKGLPLSIGFGADKLREHTDAILLVRLGRPVDAALFGSAMRLVGVVLTPVLSLLHAANARIYAAGATSVGSARSMALRLTAPAAAYGVLVAVALAFAAPAVTVLLPAGYSRTADALRWLSVIPLLTAIEVFAATALTASGLHRYRVLLNIGAAVLNVALDVALIPSFGWRGAVGATIATATIYVGALWSVLVLADRGTDRARLGVT